LIFRFQVKNSPGKSPIKRWGYGWFKSAEGAFEPPITPSFDGRLAGKRVSIEEVEFAVQRKLSAISSGFLC
jgi:hypothetical protein